MKLKTITPEQISIQSIRKSFLSVSSSTSHLYFNFLNNNIHLLNSDKSNMVFLKDNISRSTFPRSLITVNSSQDNKSEFSINSRPLLLCKKHSFYGSNVQAHSKLVSLIRKPIPFIELKGLLLSPFPNGYSLICNIKIEYKKCLNVISPKIILSLNNNERVILIAKKRLCFSGIVYSLYLAERLDQCIGVLESNVQRNKYKLYKLSVDNLNNKIKKNFICGIQFNRSLFGLNNNPMVIEVTFSNCNSGFPIKNNNKMNYTPVSKPISKCSSNKSLLSVNKECNTSISISNKKPKWFPGIF